MNDELIAKTPIGEIVVGIKSDHDYPGIFVELRGEHLNDRFKEGAVRLAWVEYSSDKQCLQTIAYGDGNADDFTHLIEHEHINARLMKPLFYDGNFNRDGKKMRAVFEREISDGTVSYRLWRSDGKPDIQYPRAENDNYLLYAEIRDYLVPLRITDFYLIDHAGYPAAVAELYGNKDARNDYFDNLRKSGDDAVLEAVRRERERIMLLGSDPACQASYIKKLFDNNVACFWASKENGGESFPDYVGALILGELDKCVALSAVYRKKEDEVAKVRRAKAEAEERAFCEEQNRLSEQAVQEAIRTIKDGGVLQNRTVKFYRSRYRCNAFSIVNYLMRKYGVNVPLRTQGWINEKLTSVTIENGKCEHLRYMRAKGAQCSQRFFDCMSELIHNVCAETEG